MKWLMTGLLLLAPMQVFADEPEKKRVDPYAESRQKMRDRQEEYNQKVEIIAKDVWAMEKKIIELEAQIALIERRLKLYEPERAMYPWEHRYFREMRKEFQRMPLGRVVEELADELDEDDPHLDSEE